MYSRSQKNVFKNVRFDGQNGASVSVPFPLVFTVYRLPLFHVFRFPFCLLFGRFTQMKKGLEHTERINISALGTSPRYIRAIVAASSKFIGQRRRQRLRMGEWQASDRRA